MLENNKKKKLSNSQIELLKLKLNIMNQADLIFHQTELDFMKTLNNVAFEQNISKKDLTKWGLNEEGTHLELIKK